VALWGSPWKSHRKAWTSKGTIREGYSSEEVTNRGGSGGAGIGTLMRPRRRGGRRRVWTFGAIDRSDGGRGIVRKCISSFVINDEGWRR